ncbi:C4-dicarboxylate ABC transporter permease (plasmid) [Paracoccus yeei]|uniref:TRAP transporter large permease protein n=1 Tax=Paracoccus yeei TaxID=147645 RepID=A0A1V0GYD9_9RHOB|nr:TRAP transporter large permease subunit [Paracoccus yeei]ARC38884.1 C4-dicarboxylate ABC transporter permease [Paracoccus yeei]
MEVIGISLIAVGLFAFLGLGVWVFVALLATAVLSLLMVAGMSPDRVGAIASSVVLRYAGSAELAAIPMFIWMGEILFRSDISDRLFRGLSPFVTRLPGGLVHTNILGCTMFAAISGSSAATTATVGKITVRKLHRRQYDSRLVIGSLAGAGSLGLMIPPSIAIIVYGILAEVSVSRLFAAGVIPGLVVAGLCSGYIFVNDLFSERPSDSDREGFFPLTRYLHAVGDLLPIVVLMLIVLGSIYSGLATPSEAAAVGVLGSLVIVTILGQFSIEIVTTSLAGALRSSCMVMTVLLAAAVLSTTMGYLHIPARVAQGIGQMHLPPYMLILILAMMYIGLGMLLDGISMIVMTLPITLPLIQQAGFDPVWFGIFLILMAELSQITPPVGMNLFVLQGMTGRPIAWIARAATPFFLLMCLAALLLTVFPGLALWLPNILYN